MYVYATLSTILVYVGYNTEGSTTQTENVIVGKKK